MQALKYSRERIDAVLAEISRLNDLDFPYDHSKAALRVIALLFEERRRTLKDLTDRNAPAVVQTACAEALLQVFRHLPLLGFILRSTDTRNSFEVFGPLLRLAQRVLGPDTKLVMSSEWSFSPYVLSDIPEISDFVLLGLPASESNNALLMPLAGHELGHTAWQKRRLSASFGPRIQQHIDDAVQEKSSEYSTVFGRPPSGLFLSKDVAPAFQWALRQTEETFCDCMGVGLFSESYFHAFAYLVAPGPTVQRPAHYPNTRRRVQNLVRAAERFKVGHPPSYAEMFIDQAEPTDQKANFLLELADAASQLTLEEVLLQVETIASETGVALRSDEKVDAAIRAFRLVIPATDIGDLPNLLNAGWRTYHDETVWGDMPPVEKATILSELLLKSIEILEIEERIKGLTA